jgi:hypothetical protein
MINRRRSQRVLPPIALYGSIRAAEKVRIIDISPHGAQVEVDTPLIPADTCSVSVPFEDGELRMKALVNRCQAFSGGDHQYRAGLEFVKLSHREIEQLEDSIVDICLTELP